MNAKQLIFAASAALASTAFAGTSEPVSAPAPVQEAVASGGWFIGASYGQLNGTDTNVGDTLGLDALGIDEISDIPGLNGGLGDLDFDMYSLQFGRTMGDYYGFKTTVYLEVGLLAGDADGGYDLDLTTEVPNTEGSTYGELLEDAYYDATGGDLYEDYPKLNDDFLNANVDIDIDIIPVTLNFMAERNIAGGFGFYVSGGLGYAFTDCSVDISSDIGGENYSDNDGGFYAQASAGLHYYFTENFALFGGARYLYLESLNLGESDIELDSDLGWEVGMRMNF